jgi:hypothetical protein
VSDNKCEKKPIQIAREKLDAELARVHELAGGCESDLSDEAYQLLFHLSSDTNLAALHELWARGIIGMIIGRVDAENGGLCA